MNKTNIYGDYKVCIKCSDPADVIEGTKNYCIECWYKHVNGKSFKEVEKHIKEEELFIEEYNRINSSKAENKKQYKGENK